MYHSLHQATKKNADGDCKLAGGTLQDSKMQDFPENEASFFHA